jgi:hypothetical protein
VVNGEPSLNETALERLGQPEVVELEQYYTARATETGVVMRDVIIEEFQRSQQAEKTTRQ